MTAPISARLIRAHWRVQTSANSHLLNLRTLSADERSLAIPNSSAAPSTILISDSKCSPAWANSWRSVLSTKNSTIPLSKSFAPPHNSASHFKMPKRQRTTVSNLNFGVASTYCLHHSCRYPSTPMSRWSNRRLKSIPTSAYRHPTNAHFRANLLTQST